MSRQPTNIYKFLGPTDNQLLGFLKEVYGLENVQNFSIQIAPRVNLSFNGDVGEITSRLAKSGKGRQILEATFQGTAKQVNTAAISFAFNRGESIGGNLQPSNKFAEIVFQQPQQDEELSIKIANLVEKHFKTALPGSSNTAGDEVGIFVTQLAEISTSIADNLAKSQLDAEQKAQQRLEQLDQQAEKLRKAIEAERASLQKSYEDRASELDTREAELNNARARSERRGLRQSINEALRNSLENEINPQSARFARYPIVIVAFAGLAFSLFFAYFSFNQFTQLITQLGQVGNETGGSSLSISGASINWFFASLLVRGSIGLAAASFFGYYLIRYFKNLEETANRRALDLERYLFDIDRASWVIETIMELKEEEGISEIPEPWLKGATHNLFGSDTGSDEDGHNPLESLGELLASGARLKIGNGSGELELPPKVAKRIAKDSGS